MGAGIAQAVALGGYTVRLYDVVAGQLPLAQGRIAASLARGVGRGATTQGQADEALARVTTVDTIAEAVTGADLVIEAAVEDEAVKKAVYAEVVPNLAPHALLATNTSSISITRLASSTDRPDRFIGLHFMKPAPVMKLVEIIRGIATSAETHSAAVAFAESLGKTTTDAEDFPAFIVNRILVPMMNEAIYTLYEGVGNVASIDQALRLGANHPMGPLELADFMGLDVVLAIMNVLYDGLADSKYRPCPLLVKYVEAGWLGRKSGRGFYDYSGDTPVPTR
ncbi:3-hydroxybutyryl-CoA dehydrogenase [Rhodospirillum rubrum]|nr:3-hydroxybutyryl-CoA dehydrogenase [Rhodospirillum rubrum]